VKDAAHTDETMLCSNKTQKNISLLKVKDATHTDETMLCSNKTQKNISLECTSDVSLEDVDTYRYLPSSDLRMPDQYSSSVPYHHNVRPF